MIGLQPEFLLPTEASLAAARTAFGDRLSAFYLHGSVAQGDAVPHVSDLDAMLVLRDAVTEHDRAQQLRLQEALLCQYPVFDEIHLNLIGESDLAGNSFACFALKYNAALLWGRDVTAEHPCPAPDTAMAKSRLAFARQCFDDALAGKQPACTGPLPADPYWRARKFARYFVIIEGAYYLMSQSSFRSFRAQDVLPALQAAAPQFDDVLALTQAVLQNAQVVKIPADAYLSAIKPFVNWLFTHIDIA